jgi:hypothetical protein
VLCPWTRLDVLDRLPWPWCGGAAVTVARGSLIRRVSLLTAAQRGHERGHGKSVVLPGDAGGSAGWSTLTASVRRGGRKYTSTTFSTTIAEY